MEDGTVMNKVEVLYEDNHIIVVVKPHNMLSQSDDTKDFDLLSWVKQYLKEKYQKPGNVYVGLVHRLDRPVSGIMVFAKTSKAASRLANAVRLHEVTKKYCAVVHGLVEEQGTFCDYLEKTKDYSTIVTTKERGKYAELSYRRMAYLPDKDLSLVDISLKTGRHHQIRVQFASRGFPLYGDRRYGREEGSILCLHAYCLSFVHPVTKEKMEFFRLPAVESAFSYFDLQIYWKRGDNLC